VKVVEFGRLTQARRAELEGDELDPFDVSGVTLQFRPKERHVALQDERGRLIASTGMVVAEVEVGGARLAVVGIGGVIVNARHRGRGLARRVVEAALERARELEPRHPARPAEFALLFCLPDRVGLYLRLGFTEIADEVLVKQPVGYAPMPLRTMWRALREGAQWPEGPVVLQGLPF
jgi:GNAT superfamily N-acetyltransferase